MKLTENRPTGRWSGEELRRLGYTFFKADREYNIAPIGEDGIVQVTSWCGDEGPDEDGFGREEYYDWWLLDGDLRPIPVPTHLHSWSYGDIAGYPEKWAGMRRTAASFLRLRRKLK